MRYCVNDPSDFFHVCEYRMCKKQLFILDVITYHTDHIGLRLLHKSSSSISKSKLGN